MSLSLASIHIPKTAGTSFARILEQWYPGRVALHYPSTATVQPVTPDTAVLHGHLTQPEMPVANVTIAWLRHPVDRVISHYTYWRHVRPERNPPALYHEVRAGMPLLDFAAATANLQTEYVPHPDRLDWIGTVERFAGDLHRLARLLGTPNPDRIPHANAAGVPHNVTRDQRRQIMRHNRDDLELWMAHQ